MAAVNNTVNSVTIQSSRSTCTEVIHVVDDGTLIVVHRKSVSATKHTLAIQECVDMLRKGKFVSDRGRFSAVMSFSMWASSSFTSDNKVNGVVSQKGNKSSC